MNSPAEPPPKLLPEAPRGFVAMAVLVEGGLGMVAIGLGWLLGHPPLGLVQWSAADCAAALPATVPLLVVFWLCLRLPLRPFRELLRIVEELLVPLFRHARVIDLAVISALAGFGEELLFRGLIQEGAGQWIGGPWGGWIGWVLAAALFGAAHWITTTYAVLATLIGLYLGWLWTVTGNLLVPILAHALYDFAALVYLTRLHRAGSSEPTPSPDSSRHASPDRGGAPWAWTRKRRRRKLRAEPFSPAWEEYLAGNFRHDAWLSESDRAKLRDLVKVFVAEKRWEGCGGLEMTDEIRVTVSAMACLMLLGTEDYCFDGVRSVLVYPGAFVKPPQSQSAWGWIEDNRPILGEAWHRGPVVISWAHALDRGRHPGGLPNVVLHEFAHQIDGLDGEMGGTPPLRSREEYRRWTRVVTAEYHRLTKSVRRGEPT